MTGNRVHEWKHYSPAEAWCNSDGSRYESKEKGRTSKLVRPPSVLLQSGFGFVALQISRKHLFDDALNIGEEEAVGRLLDRDVGTMSKG